MVFGPSNIVTKISVENMKIENAEILTLGSNVMYELDCKKEISVRTAKAVSKFNGTGKVMEEHILVK